LPAFMRIISTLLLVAVGFMAGAMLSGAFLVKDEVFEGGALVLDLARFHTIRRRSRGILQIGVAPVGHWSSQFHRSP
jgi:hypothetical protein